MPNHKEVFSLIHSDATRPALVPGHPFVNVAPFAVPTTSTPDAASSSKIWPVSTQIFSGMSQQGKGACVIWRARTLKQPVPALSALWQASLPLGIALLGAAVCLDSADLFCV